MNEAWVDKAGATDEARMHKTRPHKPNAAASGKTAAAGASGIDVANR